MPRRVRPTPPEERIVDFSEAEVSSFLAALARQRAGVPDGQAYTHELSIVKELTGTYRYFRIKLRPLSNVVQLRPRKR